MLALWLKAIRDVRWQLIGSVALMIGFHWIRVWIISLFPMRQFQRLLGFLPDTVLPLLPVPKEQLASVAGRIAIAYDDPLPMMTLAAWAIGRGSDAVAGEVGRGTMELLLAQPVRRLSVLGTQAAVTTIGSALIAYAMWVGTRLGIGTVALEEAVSPTLFLPAALNAFAVGYFLAGLTTLVSSFSRFRSRVIGLMAVYFAVSMVLKVVGLVKPELHWMLSGSFLSAYEPQILVAEPEFAWSWTEPTGMGGWQWGGLSYQGILLALGTLFYGIAMAHFCRRDLPAPL
jgi:ABC-2 type transport system permease protein